MNNYIESIKIALLFFPLVAFAISLPFIMVQYHRYGSISVWKAFLIYSFVLYLTCAYFLVILPLPDINEVATMATPRTQLVPFKFIYDFLAHTSLNILNPQTYWPAMTESYFFVPIYNILLTMPFGMFLHYYYKWSLKKVAVASFGLSLFFELTQLSGLYFIYPRGYRLFDVDDLLLNTLGGVVGYIVVIPLLKILPDMSQVDLDAKRKGQEASGPRRFTAAIMDLCLCLFIISMAQGLLPSGFDDNLISMIVFVIYFFVIPSAMQGSTLVEKFLWLRIEDSENKVNIWRIWLRRGLFVIFYVAAPMLLSFLARILTNDAAGHGLLLVIMGGIIIIYDVVSVFKYLFTAHPLLYEKLSHTHIASTITPNLPNQDGM